MSKFIINQESIELETHLLTTYDNLLNSTIKSSHQQLKLSHKSLSIIKQFLIHFTLGSDHQKKDAIDFIRFQSQLQLNATMILIRWISLISDRILATDPHQIDAELLHQFVLALNLIQGLLHLHPPSQKLFSSQFNLQVLLRFLSPSLEIHELQSITIPLLDLLLTTFIDSSYNKQLFESSGGLEILIKAMKNKQIKKEFRVKVLETVWGWWIDEELDDDENNENPISKQSKLNPFQQHNTPIVSSTTATPGRSTPNQSERRDRIINRNDENPKATPGNSRLRPISLPPPSITTTMADTNEIETSDKETPRARKMSTPIHTPRQESHRTREIGQGHSRVQSSDRKLGSSNMVKSSSTSSPMIKSSSSTSSPMMKSSLSNGLPTPMIKSTSSGLPGMSTPVMKSSSGLPSNPSSALKPSSSTPIPPRSSGDPSTRLRQMLENTASDFVPATPQHNRIKLLQTPRRAYGLNKSQPATSRSHHRQYHLSSESDDIPEESDEDQHGTPTKLFPKGEKPTSGGVGSKHAQLGSRRVGINTPQRMLRHKQSASLGSIPFQSSKPRIGSDEDQESPVQRSPQVYRKENKDERFWNGESSEEDREKEYQKERRRNRTDLPLSTDRINLRERHSSVESMGHDPTLSHDEGAKDESKRRLRRSRGSIDGVKLNAVLSSTSGPGTPLSNSGDSRPLTPVSRPMTPSTLDQTSSTPLPKKTVPSKAAHHPHHPSSLTQTPNIKKVNKKDIEMMINEDSEMSGNGNGNGNGSRSGSGSGMGNGSFVKKNQTLEKYMGNSEQLLKRFEEMKIGLNMMMINGN